MSDGCVGPEDIFSSAPRGAMLDWLGLIAGASAALTSPSALRGLIISEQGTVPHRSTSPVSQGADVSSPGT